MGCARDVGWGQRMLPWILCVAGIAPVLGCSGVDDDRAPPPPPCVGNDCGVPPGGSVSGGGGSSTGGSGNMAGAPSSPTTDLTGDVGLLSEDTFLQAIPFNEPATIFGAGPGTSRVSGSYDGTDFTLNDVLEGNSVSMAVRPADTLTVFDTISDADTTQASITLPVVQRGVIEDIYQGLTTPAEVSAAAAHVVVRVIGTNGVPVPGVTVTVSSAEFVAYSTVGTWSDTETVTDVTGLAVLGNVAASSFPGNELTLRLGGAVTLEEPVRVARGFVTLSRVVVVP